MSARDEHMNSDLDCLLAELKAGKDVTHVIVGLTARNNLDDGVYAAHEVEAAERRASAYDDWRARRAAH